jgi:hypothetical protein
MRDAASTIVCRRTSSRGIREFQVMDPAIDIIDNQLKPFVRLVAACGTHR